MNRVFLSGRLTRDVELKQGNGNSTFARAGIAVDRQTKEKTAEFLYRYFAKGSKLLLESHLHFDSYEKDGKKLSRIAVIADSLEFADSKKKAADISDFEGEDLPPDDTPF